MAKKRNRGLTRRQFGKLTAAGALVVGGPAFLFPDRAKAAGKTLKIIQWSHFVPGYDKWFDGVYTKEWGAKNDTEVIVDHVAIGEINARAAAEAAAKKGHDLFMFLSPPAAYEKQV
ncbi:MAG TPA: carbohydrate ABC transporter substrate-binding protein, partial [Thermoanaerobaculia bacterium]|nr:carbohydrate ABC transporter substrate-binding protein [Thermoanaerobaculia bacterium]